MNKNEIIYLNEKLSTLIYNLLIDEGNSKQRLKNNLLNFHRAFSLKFPCEIESKKTKVIKKLTKFPKVFFADSIVMNEYENTLFKIRNSTASKIISDIYEIKLDIEFLTSSK